MGVGAVEIAARFPRTCGRVLASMGPAGSPPFSPPVLDSLPPNPFFRTITTNGQQMLAVFVW